MAYDIWEKLDRLWNLPETLDSMKEKLMTSAQQNAENALAKLNEIGSRVGAVAVVVNEARLKIAEQAQAIADLRAQGVDVSTLDAINASADKSLDQLAGIVNPVVTDPEVPTGDVEPLPEQNPATPDPETVPVPDDAPVVVTDPSSVDVPADGGTPSTDEGAAGDTVPDANVPGADVPVADVPNADVPAATVTDAPPVDEPALPPESNDSGNSTF